jgi:hypothetical protein
MVYKISKLFLVVHLSCSSVIIFHSLIHFSFTCVTKNFSQVSGNYGCSIIMLSYRMDTLLDPRIPFFYII